MKQKDFFFFNYNISIITKLGSKNDYFFIYSRFFFLVLKQKKTFKKKISFRSDNNVIINTFVSKSYNVNWLENTFHNFINQFIKYKHFKIKFLGKGYKIRKKKNSFFFLFNKSHLTRVWWRHFYFKRLKKYKMYIKNSFFCKYVLRDIISIRRANIFTKKGLRLSKQKLLKKKGKK